MEEQVQPPHLVVVLPWLAELPERCKEVVAARGDGFLVRLPMQCGATNAMKGKGKAGKVQGQAKARKDSERSRKGSERQ